MADAVAVVNAGSSSIKFALFDVTGERPALQLRGQLDGIDGAPQLIARNSGGAVVDRRHWDAIDHAGAMHHVLEFVRAHIAGGRLLAIGHRVVHGGIEFSAPVIIDDDVLQRLDGLSPLAPLHQPHNLAAIRQLLASGVPQVACFDTAFHRSAPEVAQMFGLPRELHEQGVRRYGFHGLSYEFVAQALHECDAHLAAGRVVVLHLGAGCSMCAMAGGRSIATTMGFTALDGLLMGTRCGNLDPGVVLYLLQARGMRVEDVTQLLYSRSGLLGVSGIASDMRMLLASNAPQARQAIELFCYRIQRELGSLVAALGGIDGLVFTAGIGENAAQIRARVLDDAKWCGIAWDPAANERAAARLSTKTSPVAALIIPTDEETMIARHTLHALRARPLESGDR